jgi:hypothetical protein
VNRDNSAESNEGGRRGGESWENKHKISAASTNRKVTV